MILLTAATLALAGCGRKGPLDPPPGAAGQPGVTQDGAPAGSVFNPNAETERDPAATKGRKRPFVLDPLLD